jgi:hypothetical protein
MENHKIFALPAVQFRNTQVHSILNNPELCFLPHRQERRMFFFLGPDAIFSAVRTQEVFLA